MKPPAFQFYPDDFLGGTMHFSDAEVGLYIRLLCVQWSTGGIPNDDAELSSYGKGSTSLARVKAKFVLCDDGLLRNERLESERVKQENFRKSRSENGKLGGRPCKASENLVVLKSKAKESSPSPSPSPFVSPTTIPKEESMSASPPAPPSGVRQAAVVFDEWNKTTSLPHCLIMSDKRRRTLEVRLREPFFSDHWREALAKIQTSAFCQGENRGGWKASLDWFLQPDTVAKILEGKYDGTKKGPESNETQEEIFVKVL